jgi:hypothetical protein
MALILLPIEIGALNVTGLAVLVTAAKQNDKGVSIFADATGT